MNKIKLKPTPAIAPRGDQPGVFFIIKQNITTDAMGIQSRNELDVIVQLEVNDPAGKFYEVHKKYNLLGRGFAAFSKDFESWNGRPLTPDEVEEFDADVLLQGKKVVCAINHRKDGKDTVAVIKAFLPPKTKLANSN